MELVKEGRADVGIVGKEYKHPSLVYKRVCDDEIVLVGPASAPDRVSLNELPRLDFIVREQGSGTRKTYEEALARKDLTPAHLHATMECSSTEGIKELVAAGLGVSFISRYAISRETDQKSLHIIKIDGLAIGRTFYSVQPANKRLQRPGALLLKLLDEFVKKKRTRGSVAQCFRK